MHVKAKDGTASGGNVNALVDDGDAVNAIAAEAATAKAAAKEAATAKVAAKEAIANANRLDKLAKELLTKPPASKSAPPFPKGKGVAAPVVPRKRGQTNPDRPPKRNPGPFFDTSLADQHPPKAVVVDASLSKGYIRCVITLLLSSLF